MRRIVGFSNPGNRPAVFVDEIAKITAAYIDLKSKTPPVLQLTLVTTAAKHCGWQVSENCAVASLVRQIAAATGFKTPIKREKDWNEVLFLAALKEFVKQ